MIFDACKCVNVVITLATDYYTDYYIKQLGLNVIIKERNITFFADVLSSWLEFLSSMLKEMRVGRLGLQETYNM